MAAAADWIGPLLVRQWRQSPGKYQSANWFSASKTRVSPKVGVCVCATAKIDRPGTFFLRFRVPWQPNQAMVIDCIKRLDRVTESISVPSSSAGGWRSTYPKLRPSSPRKWNRVEQQTLSTMASSWAEECAPINHPSPSDWAPRWIRWILIRNQSIDKSQAALVAGKKEKGKIPTEAFGQSSSTNGDSSEQKFSSAGGKMREKRTAK